MCVEEEKMEKRKISKQRECEKPQNKYVSMCMLCV